MDNINRIKSLYEAYKNRSITSIEFDELTSLLIDNLSTENELVKYITEDLENTDVLVDPIADKIIAKAEINIIERTTKNIRTLRMKRIRYIAAASIALIITCTILITKNRLQPDQPNLERSSYLEDIAPGGNKATLKISDGRNYILDESDNQINTNNNIITNNGNKLVELSESIVNLELSTPRKGNYKAILPDGTKVWLNAESKIIYPSKFDTKIRKVKITGEVYLEVAKVQNSKFIVELSEGRLIEVLGTKFNINAYKEQNFIKTSLLEGKIKISNNSSQSAILMPMQKAILQNSSSAIKISHTNSDNDIAWINNKFNFEDLQFHEIMQHISRWYDVDIKYESKIPNIEFYGELDKNNSLQYIIEAFKQSGVKMRIKDNALIIE